MLSLYLPKVWQGKVRHESCRTAATCLTPFRGKQVWRGSGHDGEVTLTQCRLNQSTLRLRALVGPSLGHSARLTGCP